MSKQANNILVKQFKVALQPQSVVDGTRPSSDRTVDSPHGDSVCVTDAQDQLNSLLAEIDEQKQMLSEDDQTIATLRQAVARWEHGDEAGAQEAQRKIKDEQDSRGLSREVSHLQQTMKLREKQMADMREELLRAQHQRQNGAAASPSAGGDKQATEQQQQQQQQARNDEELRSAQHRIAVLERETNEQRHRADLLQQRNEQLASNQHKRNDEKDADTASERKQLTDKIAQLEHSQAADTHLTFSAVGGADKYILSLYSPSCIAFAWRFCVTALILHKNAMETQQREVEQAKAAMKSAFSSSAPIPAAVVVSAPTGPTALEGQQQAEIAVLKAEIVTLGASVQEKEAEVQAVKEKAKDKLNVASQSVTKMKTEYANLRAAYTKLKAEQQSVQSSQQQAAANMASKHRKQLSSSLSIIQTTRAELVELRTSVQTLVSSLPATARPLLTRQVNSLCDHFKAETAALTVAYRKEQLARKQLFNQIQELKGNIRVYCRVRPLSNREQDSQLNAISFPEANQLSIVNNEKKTAHQFEFEQVFQSLSTQGEVFSEVSDLVTSVMDGYNVCIFAYGQTGSGKTYTMQGSKEDPGVNIRALDKLFAVAGERDVDTAYSIRISLLEIYNERIQDLLSATPTQQLKAIQTATGMQVQDLTYVAVSSAAQVLDALTMGSKNRKVSSTAMNQDSSRSHLILSVYVVGKSRFALSSGAVKEVSGKLHLIDLAGSERISRSGVTGDGLKEAQAINSSLSALGNCIAARANKQAHVPYRDSTLTYLLQDSLEKNSKTLMFVQVSPNATDSAESICSLRFAERVRKVELGKAQANVAAKKG